MARDEDASRKAVKSLRSGVLDVPELARRGGLASAVTPYITDEDEQGAYVRHSGNSTATVNQHVLLGLENDIADARHYASIRPGCGPQAIATKYPNVAAFYSEGEIQQKIIAGSSAQNHAELAKEIYERHEKQNPELQKWKPELSESNQERAARRQAMIYPLLQKKGHSLNNWALQAGLSWRTVKNFWDGQTKTLTPDTLKKLAAVLGLEPQDFPS